MSIQPKINYAATWGDGYEDRLNCGGECVCVTEDGCALLNGRKAFEKVERSSNG